MKLYHGSLRKQVQALCCDAVLLTPGCCIGRICCRTKTDEGDFKPLPRQPWNSRLFIRRRKKGNETEGLEFD